MSRSIHTTRWLVALQGFTGVPDRDLKAVDLGLRVGPVFCMLLAGTATAYASPTMLLALAPLALLGAVLPGSPFDVFYNHGLRHLLNGPRLPVYRAPRRFACGLAGAWLLVTAGLLLAGATMAGQVMGWLLVATAAVPVTTGFCVPSFIFRLATRSMPARSTGEALPG
jgi:hypothetical protein